MRGAVSGMRRWLAAAAAVVVLAGCGGNASGARSAADDACATFELVMLDRASGVLTTGEWRAGLQLVEQQAAGSPVHDEARTLLAAVTQRQPLTGQIADVREACRDAT